MFFPELIFKILNVPKELFDIKKELYLSKFTGSIAPSNIVTRNSESHKKAFEELFGF